MDGLTLAETGAAIAAAAVAAVGGGADDVWVSDTFFWRTAEAA